MQIVRGPDLPKIENAIIAKLVYEQGIGLVLLLQVITT